jgi:arylsulfatase A-like enzyme
MFSNRTLSRRTLAISLATALLAFALACGAPEAELDSTPKNLVVIVVDTLRYDHLGTYGYARDTSPSIDTLAADAIRFERAYSVAPWTQPAVASLLTGLYPQSHGVEKIKAVLPDAHRTLAEILAERGYATRAVVSHLILGARFGFQQGFEAFDSSQGKGERHISTAGVTQRALAYLDEPALAEKPFFLFVHYFDPHFSYQDHRSVPYAKQKQVGRVRAGETINRLQAIDPRMNAQELQHLRDLYDEEIHHTDAGIGRVLEKLRSRGFYDDSVIVMTSDHGEEFYERDFLGHTHTLHDELLRVPYILRLPGGAHSGARVEEPVSTVSMPATVLDALGIDPDPFGFQRASVLPLVFDDAPGDWPPVFADVDYEFDLVLPAAKRRSANMRAIVRGPLKLIHDRELDRYELYDLSDDPGETRDLSAERPDLLREMQRELDAMTALAKARATGAAETEALSEAEEQMLEKLGYLEK